MKLSEMSTDQAADVMIQVAPDIELLVNDEGLAKVLKDRVTTKDPKKASKIGGIFLLQVATYLLKNHRGSTWNILGALNQKQPEEIGKQLLAETVKQITEVLTDREFMSFFQSLSTPRQVTLSDTSPKQDQ